MGRERNAAKSRRSSRSNRGHSRGRGRRSNYNKKKPVLREVPKVDISTLGSIRMYGDQEGDGAIQLSFTLPMPACPEAKVAALQFAEKMNLKDAHVLHMEAMGAEYSFFVVYAKSEFEVDVSQIQVPKLEYPQYDFEMCNEIMRSRLDRKVVVLGACIGTDAHTVGIDAIFNMKGYMGDYGLERYPMMEAHNLRAQVDTKDLVNLVLEHQADVVLVSRVVTQRDSHIVELKKFLEELDAAEGVPEHLIKICGGPRISHKEAKELGYDAGFGPGTLPSQVASYIADEVVKRLGESPAEEVEDQEE